MAHIAELMVNVPSSVGLNNYIARELSPSPVQNVSDEASPMEEKREHTWRMYQPTEPAAPRRYQLFPAKEKTTIASIPRSSDVVEASQAMAVGQTGIVEKDRAVLGGASRMKPKEQNLIKRRKASVPELGPMTTVQEVAMDSPTIPGRPPLHERSISAPGNSWRQHIFADSILSCIPGPVLDENAELFVETTSSSNEQGVSAIGPLPLTSANEQPPRYSASTKLPPLSPKTLAPLVIPSLSQLTRSHSKTRLRAGSEGAPEVPPKSARMIEASPLSRASPFTPFSATSNILSASTAPSSVTTTPSGEGRSSPKPWTTALGGRSSPKPWTSTGRSSPKPSSSTVPSSTISPIMGHNRNQSDLGSSTLHTLTHQRSLPLVTSNGHRRHESEDGTATSLSMIDRGRPKKRSDDSPSKRANMRSPSNPALPSNLTISTPTSTSTSPARAYVATSEEQRAFEYLPSGHSATAAHTLLPASELTVLRKQALGQASRFQVLAAKDVDSLARELRALDERCEYLRKTHRSLRSGRRNLHDRICSYLRSPRVARFSGEAMLKQEEALSELDRSIDDWVSKLEQAENRRTRVRQKLLEHVAAALVMQSPTAGATMAEDKEHIMSQSLSLLNTPPRSPTKAHSPDRLERVVEEVPVASPDEPTSRGGREVLSMMSAHSIKIYADSDVYALMDCVEDEITRMGEQDDGEREALDRKKEDTISAGITLNAVTFEGMAAVQHRGQRAY